MTDTLPPTEVDPSRDPALEKYFDSKMVDYQFFSALPIEEVDVEASIRNQARIENAVIPSRVAQYAEAKRRGDVFPALVGYRSGNRVVIMDGNNRFHADLEVEARTVPFYIVKGKAEILTVMTYELNRRNGERPSKVDDEKQGIHLLDTGLTVDEAAATVGLTRNVLQNLWLVEQANRRARFLGIRGWDKLSNTAKKTLRMLGSDVVFREFARFAIDGKLTVTEINEAVRAINAERSEGEQLASIDRVKKTAKEAVQERAGKRQSPNYKNPRALVLAHLNYLAKANAEDIVRACLTVEQRGEIRDQCFEVAERLLMLADQVGG